MQQPRKRGLAPKRLDGSLLPIVHGRIIPRGTASKLPRVPICMKRMLLAVLAVSVLAPTSAAREAGGTPVALVTAETLDKLLAVELPSGRVLKRLRMPSDP